MLKEKGPRPKPALAHHHITIMMLKEKGPRPQPSSLRKTTKKKERPKA
jgi:hypothetical protein